jgi:hypothetical protein
MEISQSQIMARLRLTAFIQYELQSTPQHMVTPEEMSPLGSENDKASQQPPDQDRHTADPADNNTPGRGADVSQCTSPSIFDSEEFVSPLKLARAARAQSAEQSGDSPQQKVNGFHRGTPTGILEVNGICDEDSDSEKETRTLSSSCSTDVHKTCRQNGDVVQGASTSKQQKSLNFVGEAAKGRPAYKYLPLVAVKVHQKAASKQEEFADTQSSDWGSNEVKKSGESQNSPLSEKLAEAGSISESLSVAKSELVLRNIVKMGLVSKSENGSASLEGWQLDPMQEAIGAPGAHRKGENGDVSTEKARATRQESSESVLSPFREESTTTAILTQSNWTGTSTFVTDSLCAEASTPGEILSRPEEKESTPVTFAPREETAGSSCKANGEGVFLPPRGGASTSETSREEERGSASKGSSQLSALEEYLARSEETEDVPESLSAVEAAAAMRETVRRMREDAALLALRLSALYASDASTLRTAAQSMMQHVAGMQHEMKVSGSSLSRVSIKELSCDAVLVWKLLPGSFKFHSWATYVTLCWSCPAFVPEGSSTIDNLRPADVLFVLSMLG